MILPEKDIWIELQNYYGRLDFLVKLVSEDEIKPQEIDLQIIWEKLQAILNDILQEKKNLDVAIFILFAISKLLEIKISNILNINAEEEDKLPINFALVFELQKIRKILPKLEEMMNGGMKNYVCGGYALSRIINADVATLENLTIENIYKAFKKKISETQLQRIEIKKSDYNWQEIVNEFLQILKKYKTVSFLALFKEVNNTYKMLLYFVAILELVKENLVDIVQTELYKDFTITLKDENTSALS